MEYRTGGLDFQPSPMLLENNSNYSHLQRSIDTLRSLGDRLGERNVDLRLNLHHQDLRNNDRGLNLDRNVNLNNLQMDRSNIDRPNLSMDRNLELNLSLTSERNLLQERMQHERNLSLERLISERNMGEHRNLSDRMSLEHSLSIERLNLERSLAQDRTLTDRNLNNVERMALDRNMSNGAGDRLRMDLGNELNDIKYREYKAHLDSLRGSSANENSRSIEGRTEDERGNTPSTPPTPLSVGENFQEEKVFSIVFADYYYFRATC